MLPRWMMALLILLRERRSGRRDAHIRLLRLQVEMLQSRLLGNRVISNTLAEANVSVERWRQEYDHFRLHSPSGYRPPARMRLPFSKLGFRRVRHLIFLSMSTRMSPSNVRLVLAAAVVGRRSSGESPLIPGAPHGMMPREENAL